MFGGNNRRDTLLRPNRYCDSLTEYLNPRLAPSLTVIRERMNCVAGGIWQPEANWPSVADFATTGCGCRCVGTAGNGRAQAKT